jgi:2-desacetyl-2-hydroxyethyl bacteriochlorophyllide A dehydrogenase
MNHGAIRMKAVMISEDRKMVVTDIPEAALRPDNVRVRVQRCGICGTDLHARANAANPRWKAGCILGHEIVGEVVEAGEQVRAWHPGDRVALHHGTPCGVCAMCTSGRSHLCIDHLDAALGHGVAQGGYAENLVVPADLLHRIPDALSYDQAAIAEPLAIAVHGVRKSSLRPDDPVCVLGAGPIGAMTACALRANGSTNVVLVDPNPGRRARLSALGFSAVGLENVLEAVMAALGGRRPVAVFECAGHVDAAGLAVNLVDYSGRIVLQGVPMKPVSISQYAVVQKEVEIVGAASCTRADMDEALEHLASGRVPAHLLVTSVVSLAQADGAFDALVDPKGSELKVLIAPSL